MSIYYFENENGTFFSEDGKRRFIRLSGKEAYDYMRENKTGDLDKDTQLAGATIVGTYKVDTDGNSKTFSNLAQGIYYVRATNFPSGVKKVTNSAFALPYYTAENGWVYDLDTINLAAKVEEDNPDIEKEITNSTRNNVNVIIYSVAVSLAVAGGVILLVLRRKKKSADKSA